MRNIAAVQKTAKKGYSLELVNFHSINYWCC